MSDQPGPSEETLEVELKASWIGLDEEPVFAANQFIIQYRDDAFYLSIGHMAPPALLGTPEERMEQAKQIGVVPIQNLGRFLVTPSNMRDLVRILRGNLEQVEAREAVGDDEQADS